MLENLNTVPVCLAGMWPSTLGDPESGTRVSLIEKEGGPILLDGFSDEAGEFRGRLPASWVGKEVHIVILEPSFKYEYFNPVKVERYGLFLAIRQDKDPAYSGSMSASTINPDRWNKWNSTQEHINASQKINASIRRAKIAWPLKPLGFIIAALVGIGGFFVHPVIGLVAGVLAFFAMELLAQFLLNRGY
jgi:hypothetical protein